MKKDTNQQHKHTKQNLYIENTTMKQTDTTKQTVTLSTNPHKDHNKKKDMKKDTKQQHKHTKQKLHRKQYHHNQADRHNKANSNIKYKPTQRPQ